MKVGVSMVINYGGHSQRIVQQLRVLCVEGAAEGARGERYALSVKKSISR